MSAETMVATVGSANLDHVTYASRAPRAGETVLGTDTETSVGGKGLNQALAAARWVPTALIAAIGEDESALAIQEAMTTAGIDTNGLQPSKMKTGRAFVTVEAQAENRIVVIPGANAELRPMWVVEQLDKHRPRVVLAQLEVPMESVLGAARWVQAHGMRFILNPSPIRDVDDEVLAICDPLIVNMGEAKAMAGASDLQPPALASTLLALSPSVIVTDGGRGAFVASRGSALQHVDSRPVKVLDTTGAGDEFAGAVAAHLAQGKSLKESATAGCRAAEQLISTARSERRPGPSRGSG